MRKKFKRGDSIESNVESEGEDSGRARERDELYFTLRNYFSIHHLDKRTASKNQTLSERVRKEEEDAKNWRVLLFSVSFLLNPSEERATDPSLTGLH